MHAQDLLNAHWADLRAEDADTGIIIKQLWRRSVMNTALFLVQPASRAVEQAVRGQLWEGVTRSSGVKKER